MNTILMPEPGVLHGGDAGDAGDAVFPLEALPEVMARFVKEAAASIVCPPELVALPLLVMLGSAIGTSRVIRLKKDWTEGATLYAAGIADPGAKKTPAEAAATGPAHQEQKRMRETYRHERADYERKLRDHEAAKARAKREGTAYPEPPHQPAMGRVLVDDTTVEALATILDSNPRGVLLARDELTAWLRSMDQYKQGKGADRQHWLSMWSNRPITVDRKGNQDAVMLDRPFVGVYGGIQPDVLPELKANREDGLLDRFLLAYPDPAQSRWSDEEISDGAEQGISELYVGLRALESVAAPVDFDPDAHQVFKDLVNAHREETEAPGFPNRLQGPWSKLEAYLARLALILALARCVDAGTPERVEMQDVLRASVLLDYFKDQARKVHGALYEPDEKDLLAADVARFLGTMGGNFEDEPHVLHALLRSEHKPKRPEDLTRWLKEITKRTPALVFESVTRGRDRDKRRVSVLYLENGVPGVPGVPAEPLEEEYVRAGFVAHNDARDALITQVRADRMDQERAVEYMARLLLAERGRSPEAWPESAETVRGVLEWHMGETDEPFPL